MLGELSLDRRLAADVSQHENLLAELVCSRLLISFGGELMPIDQGSHIHNA